MESNEQTGDRGLDTRNRLAAVGGEEGGGDWMEDGEGISQKTYMNNPQTQTTVWRWPKGRGWAGGCVEVGKVGGGEGQL